MPSGHGTVNEVVAPPDRYPGGAQTTSFHGYIAIRSPDRKGHAA